MSTDMHWGARAPISLEELAAALAPFRVELSGEQLLAIQEYVSLLLQWNRSISLTAIDDPIEIVNRHFGESFFGASMLKIGKSRLADVGSGAGFPGLVMKIADREMNLTLFESNSKKCAFLTEISQRLGFSGVSIVRGRYEEYRVDGARFDFVCSRALGNYRELLPWARSVLKRDGRLALWVGTDESIRLERRPDFEWDAPIPIPESRRRVILVGRPSGL